MTEQAPKIDTNGTGPLVYDKAKRTIVRAEPTKKSRSALIGEIVSKDGDIERLKSRVAILIDLAYAPDGREHRSLMFGAVAENQALKQALIEHRTLTITDQMVENGARAICPWAFTAISNLDAMPEREQQDVLRRCQRRENEEARDKALAQSRAVLEAAIRT